MPESSAQNEVYVPQSAVIPADQSAASINAVDSKTGQNLLEQATGLLSEGVNSALYAGIQQPYDGIKQLFESLPELHLAHQPEHADFLSPKWVVQQTGGAVGTIADFALLSGAYKLAGRAVGLECVSPFGKIGTAALTGATMGLVFTPVLPGQDPEKTRLLNGLTQGVTFGALTGFGLAAERLIAQPLSPIANSFANRLMVKAGTGALVGTVSGAFSAEVNSLVAGRGLAGTQELLESATSMGMLGGMFGAAEATAPNLRSLKKWVEGRIVVRGSTPTGVEQEGSHSIGSAEPPESVKIAAQLNPAVMELPTSDRDLAAIGVAAYADALAVKATAQGIPPSELGALASKFASQIGFFEVKSVLAIMRDFPTVQQGEAMVKESPTLISAVAQLVSGGHVSNAESAYRNLKAVSQELIPSDIRDLSGGTINPIHFAQQFIMDMHSQGFADEQIQDKSILRTALDIYARDPSMLVPEAVLG